MSVKQSKDVFFDIILAATKKGGIGINNDLPWRLKKELHYFRDITKATTDPNSENVMIMGRNTWTNNP